MLGGIGFTWEHDAHLYLRRARRRCGSRSAARPVATPGRRADPGRCPRAPARRPRRREADARSVRPTAARRSPRCPRPQRRVALADAGYLAPHWPRAVRPDADAGEQLVIDAGTAPRRRRAGRTWSSAAWAVPTILEHGTPEQIERFVRPDAARRDSSGASCSASPAPVPTSPRCAPAPSASTGGWRLTGQKVWTSAGARRPTGGSASPAPNPDAPKHKGITLLPGRHDQRRASTSGRCARSPARRCSTRCSSTTSSCRTTAWSASVDGGWRLARTTLAQRAGRDGQRLERGRRRSSACVAQAARSRTTPTRSRTGSARSISRGARRLAARPARDAAPARRPRPGRRVERAQAVGVRHRQAVAEPRSSSSARTAIAGRRAARVPADPLPVDRRRHDAGAAVPRGRTHARPATRLALDRNRTCSSIGGMDRLSGLDASFLYFETPAHLMHVCGLLDARHRPRCPRRTTSPTRARRCASGWRQPGVPPQAAQPALQHRSSGLGRRRATSTSSTTCAGPPSRRPAAERARRGLRRHRRTTARPQPAAVGDVADRGLADGSHRGA